MGLKLYSAARAALTGGDGMFDIGQRLPANPDEFWNTFLAQWAAGLSMTYEEFVEAQNESWDRMFDAWLCGHLGYHPQRLLGGPI